MKKALIVGIDNYDHVGSLSGCVSDASSVRAILERNADGSPNFVTPKSLIAGATQSVTRSALKAALRELFSDDADIALFYFAGHGCVEDTGGFLFTSDTACGDEGIALSEVITLANRSKAKNKVIILDSCHSGILGNRPDGNGLAEVCEGMTILTASTEHQYAKEANGTGVFTSLSSPCVKRSGRESGG